MTQSGDSPGLRRPASKAVRADRRRLQHQFGHSRLSRRRRPVEAAAAGDGSGLHGRRGDAPALLGAQPDRMAAVQPGPAERRPSRARPARGEGRNRASPDPERGPAASGGRQRPGDRPARAARLGPLPGLRAQDIARRGAGGARPAATPAGSILPPPTPRTATPTSTAPTFRRSKFRPAGCAAASSSPTWCFSARTFPATGSTRPRGIWMRPTPC